MATALKKEPFHVALDIIMDGRTNRWLMDKSGIHESEISKLRTGRLNPTDAQIDKIVAVFPTFKFDKQN